MILWAKSKNKQKKWLFLLHFLRLRVLPSKRLNRKLYYTILIYWKPNLCDHTSYKWQFIHYIHQVWWPELLKYDVRFQDDEPEVFLVDAVSAVLSTNGWHRLPNKNNDDNESAQVDNWNGDADDDGHYLPLCAIKSSSGTSRRNFLWTHWLRGEWAVSSALFWNWRRLLLVILESKLSTKIN